MKSYFLTTLIQYKLLLVLRGLDDELFTRPFNLGQYFKIEGVPESAKRILQCRQPLQSLASANQGLIGLCQQLLCVSISVCLTIPGDTEL